MKSTILFITSVIISINSFSQEVYGTYSLTSNGDINDFELKRTLILNQDGTFYFHNYRYIEQGIPKETNLYGRGRWQREKNVIIFSTDSSEFTDKYTLDFNGTRARYISKSPRDKSDRIIPTSLSFYQSEIFWIKGMKLLKQ